VRRGELPVASGAGPRAAHAGPASAAASAALHPDAAAAGERVSRPRRVIGMRLVVTSTAVALITAAVLGMGAVAERQSRRALAREVEARLLLEARHLALSSAGALLSDLPELALHPLVRELQQERPELAFVVVLDHKGMVQGHADARRLGEAWSAPPGLGPQATATRLGPGERLLASRRLLVVESPVTSAAGQRLGAAVIGMQRAYLDNAVASSRRQQGLVLVALLALGVTVTLVLMTALMRPLAVLRQGLERIGTGDLETPLRLRDRTELGLLADTVNQMAARLRAAQREAVERERLAHEVELAREIQQRLLPKGPLRIGEYSFTGAHRAAAEVGGDAYDVLPLADGRVALAIADVSGKGLAGCLVMSMLSALLRALHATQSSPAALLVELERQLQWTLPPGGFVTMFYGILEPASGRLTYASAGHSPLLLYRRATGATEWRRSPGVPLGAVRGALGRTLADECVELGPGDLAVQFTDGYTEAFDMSGRQFGQDRIARLVAGSAPAGGDAVVAALTSAIQVWAGDQPPLDDETLLVMARAAATPAAVGIEAGTATVTPAGAELLAVAAAAGAIAVTPPLPPPEHPRPAIAASGASRDPVATLLDARRSGHGLVLEARLDELERLRGWVSRCDGLEDLDPHALLRVESALYEACANVVEHGYHSDAEQRLELWWLAARAQGARRAPGDGPACGGWFVLCDQGFPFSPGRRLPNDLNDPAVRRRGRGFGLDILHLVMTEVVYRPATAAGNITLMAYDPARVRGVGEETDP
jgi:serine phosphatase RsbU (regulator of sigma subunit)/anti-sigma regulatory factor (Ser/Thr protein kinase)